MYYEVQDIKNNMHRIAASALLVISSCDAFMPHVLPLHNMAAAAHSSPGVCGQSTRGWGGLLASNADADGEKETSALIGRRTL